jgi:Cys-tRNA(Pro)/Cys-tRNA(Cys) deacylase
VIKASTPSRCSRRPHASGGPQVVALEHGSRSRSGRDIRLGVAVLPVPAKLSLKATAAALGVPKAAMAERAAAERSSGYVIGGISPLGQRRPLPTVVDESALRWERVLCSAGKRGWDIALAPADLIALTRAVTADIGT